MPSSCKSDSRAPQMVALTPAQLTDLPLELLHDIFGGFDTRTLVRLSHTCRRLLHVTRSLIFKHQIAHLQFWMDSGYLVTAPRMEMKGLVQFEDIRLNYVRLNMSDSSSWMTLYSCYGLFSRINHAGHVELQLSLGPTWKNPDIFASGWTRLVAVMNAITGRPESVLTVRGGGGSGVDWPFAYTLVPKFPSSTSFPAAYLDTTKNSASIIVRRLLRRFESFRKSEILTRPPDIPVDIPTQACEPVFRLVQKSIRPPPHHLPCHPLPLLHGLHINGNQLLRLSLFSWTINTINKASISCLSIQKTDLRPDDWAHVLRSITIPTLSDLSLASSQIAFSDLESFLSRHPSIIILNLLGGSPFGPLMPYCSGQLLPRLTELSGDPIYLGHFLQPLRAYPALSRITMSSKIGTSTYENQYGRLDTVLGLIAQRTQNMTLVLLMETEAGPLNWFHKSKHPPVRNVTVLEIRHDEQIFLPDYTELAICKWLRKFPSLLHFKIQTIFESNDTIDLLWDRYGQLETVDCGEHIYRRPTNRRVSLWRRGLYKVQDGLTWCGERDLGEGFTNKG